MALRKSHPSSRSLTRSFREDPLCNKWGREKKNLNLSSVLLCQVRNPEQDEKRLAANQTESNLLKDGGSAAEDQQTKEPEGKKRITTEGELRTKIYKHDLQVL